MVAAPEELSLRKLPHSVTEVERSGNRPFGVLRHPARGNRLESRQYPSTGRSHLRMRFEKAVIAFEELGHHPLVVVDDHDVFAPALGNAPVPGGRNSLLRFEHHPGIELRMCGNVIGEPRGGIVRTVVVHDDDLPLLLRQRLHQERIERRTEFRTPVVSGYDKRQSLFRHHIALFA